MKLRITSDGTVQGLWDDSIDWSSLGRISVHLASYVEFCNRRQLWCVRSGRNNNALLRLSQLLTGRPSGEVLYLAPTRSQALDWERKHFGPGGPGWQSGDSGLVH